MIGAHAEGGGEGEIGQGIGFADLPDQPLHGGAVADLLPGENVKHRSPRVPGLDVVLEVEGFEQVVGELYRQLARIRVEGLVPVSAVPVSVGAYDVGVSFPVDPGEAVGRSLRRGGFQVEVVPRFLLEPEEAVPHEVKDLPGEPVTFR